jgi:methionine sulfoxide reductase catalytic subunit
MLIRRPPDLLASEITDESLFWNRRDFIAAAGLGAAALGGLVPLGRLLPPRSADEKLTPWEDVTGYNNYYEFGTDKGDPASNAGALRTKPWKVDIAGEVKRPALYDLDELLKPFTPVERVYRMRCVEGWSMVVPWLGIPLGQIIDRLEPTSKAKYVEFTTLLDPQQMPGQQRRILEWPYVEGLRMDEARHALALMVTGVYGKALPNQNGAPLRLIVPWKYGFKGGKSIVKIRFR